MTDEALKPCPFCDEQCATLVIDQGYKWAHYEPSCLEVRTGYDLSDDAAWRAEAITAWNTRAGDGDNAKLREALHFYADWPPKPQPSEGPWGVNSQDFGGVARAALKETGQ